MLDTLRGKLIGTRQKPLVIDRAIEKLIDQISRPQHMLPFSYSVVTSSLACMS